MYVCRCCFSPFFPPLSSLLLLFFLSVGIARGAPRASLASVELGNGAADEKTQKHTNGARMRKRPFPYVGRFPLVAGRSRPVALEWAAPTPRVRPRPLVFRLVHFFPPCCGLVGSCHARASSRRALGSIFSFLPMTGTFGSRWSASLSSARQKRETYRKTQESERKKEIPDGAGGSAKARRPREAQKATTNARKKPKTREQENFADGTPTPNPTQSNQIANKSRRHFARPHDASGNIGRKAGASVMSSLEKGVSLSGGGQPTEWTKGTGSTRSAPDNK